jgi:collagenase-like PrtC family protease
VALMSTTTAKLTLGPLFYNWPAEKRRDFYFQIADEAAVDVVYLGEVVCSKREAFAAPVRDAVVERLKRAGKEIVFSTLALVTTEREMAAIRERAAAEAMIEANDVAAFQALTAKPFVVGPFINVLNEGAMAFVRAAGATRVVFPTEMTVTAMSLLAASSALETEVQVFGRQPLAVSMRCYHARAQGRDKDHCRIACAEDPEGFSIATLDNEPFLTVNGTQLLARGYGVLLREMPILAARGMTHFRLSPQNRTMPPIFELFRAVLDGHLAPAEAETRLHALTGPIPFANGFAYGREGLLWLEEGLEA